MNKDKLVQIAAYVCLAILSYGAYLYFSDKPAEQPQLTEEAQIDNLLQGSNEEAKQETAEAKQEAADTKPEGVAPVVDSRAEQKVLLESYTDKISKNNNDVDSYYKRAVIYQNNKQYSQAISDYTEVLRILPKSANAFFNRGIVQTERKDYAKAINDLSMAIDLSPEDPIFYNARGVAYFATDNMDKAAADYKKAIELDPDFGEAYFNLGTVFDKQDNKQEALVQYDKSIATYASADDAANVDAATAAAELNRMLEVYYRRALVKFQLQNYDAALQDINYFIERNTKSIKAYRLRSAIYTKIGNSGAALEDENTAQNLGFEDLLR